MSEATTTTNGQAAQTPTELEQLRETIDAAGGQEVEQHAEPDAGLDGEVERQDLVGRRDLGDLDPRLLAPVGLLVVSLALAAVQYLALAPLPSEVSAFAAVGSAVGFGYVAEMQRRDRLDGDDHHPDERACMMPSCSGTVRAISKGTVRERPACRLCGVRYDVSVSLTRPDSYLDVTREASETDEEREERGERSSLRAIGEELWGDD